jgi:hypothetical protein
MAVQSLGNPQITGKTLDALRISTQFWMQQAFNHLDKITGLRGTPQLFSSLDAGGNTITNVGEGINPNDVVTRAQTLTLETTSTGTVFNANTIPIVNSSPAVLPTDVPTLNQVQTLVTSAIGAATSGLTFTALAVGFSIAGGTVSKTLTVDLNLTASTIISVAGTGNRITTSGTTTLSAGGTISTIDIAATYVGQASITTLGTIGTGVWQGTVVAGQYGGTGVANTGKTITLGGNLTTTGAFASTFAVSGAFTYTFPTATSTLLANTLGISGGTTLIGDTAASGNLTLQSTSNATKGKILVGTSAYDEVNNRLGIANAAPTTTLDVTGIITSLLGTSSGKMTDIGRADTQTSATGIGNGADATDDTLFTYSLPLNAMSANGRVLRSLASGHFAANGNDKRVKFFFAGTAVADSAVVTHNNKDWDCEIEVVRIDSTHVSARGIFTTSGIAPVVTVTPNLVVADLTANASVVKVTGASPTSSAANDVLGYMMNTNFSN